MEIWSVNPLGKIAKALEKKKNSFDENVGKSAEGWKKALDYWTDDISRGDLEKFVSDKFGRKFKLGNYRGVPNKYGAMYKFFGGFSEPREYVGGYVYRNGKETSLYPDFYSVSVDDAAESLKKRAGEQSGELKGLEEQLKKANAYLGRLEAVFERTSDADSAGELYDRMLQTKAMVEELESEIESIKSEGDKSAEEAAKKFAQKHILEWFNANDDNNAVLAYKGE